MKKQREQARQAAIDARTEGAATAKRIRRGPRIIEESLFRSAVIEVFKRYRKSFDSDAAMGKALGISQASVNKILSGRQDPRLETVGKVMDAMYAELRSPWEPKNETKRIALTGTNSANAQKLHAVMRHEIVDGAASKTDDVLLAKPEEELRQLSETLSLGGFVVSEDMRVPDEYPAGSSVVVDFASKPSDELDGDAHYLVKTNSGDVCIAQAWEGRYVIDFDKKDLLEQGKDYDDFADAAIGRVVMHIRFT